jgi:hypothetical protein
MHVVRCGNETGGGEGLETFMANQSLSVCKLSVLVCTCYTTVSILSTIMEAWMVTQDNKGL